MFVSQNPCEWHGRKRVSIKKIVTKYSQPAGIYVHICESNVQYDFHLFLFLLSMEIVDTFFSYLNYYHVQHI